MKKIKDWIAKATARFQNPHLKEVMNIPADEPIFVLRAQDALALIPLYSWIDLAEKKRVNDEKIASAWTAANEMQAYQEKHGNKIPD